MRKILLLLFVFGCISCDIDNISSNGNDDNQPDNIEDAIKTTIYYTTTDENVLELPSDAFDKEVISNTYKNGIGQIVFNGEVTLIDDYAFDECETLQTITLPNTIEIIGESAFAYCISLNFITIPKSVTSIDKYAFCCCSRITEVDIPESVISIGEGCFTGCNNLQSITGKYCTEDNLAIIVGDKLVAYALGCRNTSFEIPDGVKIIGADTFWESEYLESIKLPAGIEKINWMAFSSCNKLASIEIPDSCLYIDSYAFAFCDMLKSITCHAITPPTIGSEIALDNASDRKIYVPQQSIAEYKSKWSEYADDIVALTPPEYNYRIHDEWDVANPLRGEVSTSFSQGTGTYSDPYIIESAADLRLLSDQVRGGKNFKNNYFLLVNDITINNNVLNEDGTLNGDGSNFEPWIPIGRIYSSSAFHGNFDGGNHTISGLYFNRALDGGGGALFGVTRDANIKNLTVRDSYFCGEDVAGIVYRADDSDIVSCQSYVTLQVLPDVDCYAGGVASIAYGCTDKCISDCTFIGDFLCVGGIVCSAYGIIKNCYNKSDLQGQRHVGGICSRLDGYYDGISSIRNCINYGLISDGYNCGGIVGVTDGAYGKDNNVFNCVNLGDISTDDRIGGIAGCATQSRISYCYTHMDKYIGYGYEGGVYVHCFTHDEEFFKSQECLDILNSNASSGSLSLWKMGADGYPVFEWM